MIMPPLRENELKFYPKEIIKKFEKKFSQDGDKDIYYINYKNYLEGDLSYFEDITHLNEEGAKKFSKKLNEDLIEIVDSIEKIN